MKKMYPVIAALKHSPAFIKVSVTLIACCILLQVKAEVLKQLYVRGCVNTAVTITAPPPVAPASGDVTWYDDAHEGNMVGNGQTFTTPVLTESRSYWYTYGDNQVRQQAYVDVPAAPDNSIVLAQYGCLNTNIQAYAKYNPDGYALACNGSRGAFSTSTTLLNVVNLTLQAMVYWNGGNGQDQWIIQNGVNSAGYGLIVRGSDSKIAIRLGTEDVLSDVVLDKNKWVYVSAVLSTNSDWTIYINGVAHTPQNFHRGTGRVTGGLSIGNINNGNWFNGLIDYVSLWNRALGQYDVNANKYMNAPGDGLVGCWLFDETDGGTATHDQSGNSLDLTLTSTGARAYFDAGFVWNMGGTAATGVYPQYSFNSTGDKSITLAVSNMEGCQAEISAPKTININNAAVPAVAVTVSSDSVCPGDPVYITASGGGLLINQDFDVDGYYIGNGIDSLGNGWKSGGDFSASHNNYPPSDGSGYAEYNRYGTQPDAYILSPGFSTAGQTGMRLVVEQYLERGSDNAFIQLSLDSTNWETIYTLPNFIANPGNYEEDYYTVPAKYEGKSKVYLRLLFRLSQATEAGWHIWRINKAAIITTTYLPKYIWSSSPVGYNDVGTPHYVAPTVTTTYTAVANTGCNSAASSKTVYVRPLPAATMFLQGNSSICPGGAKPTIGFNGSGGTANSKHYYFNYEVNGSAKTSTNVFAGLGVADTLQNAPGSYVYHLSSVKDDYCTATADTSITAVINPVPNATISIQPNACAGDTGVRYTVTGSNGTAPYIYKVYDVTSGFARTVTGKASGAPSVSPPLALADLHVTYTYNLELQNVSDANGCANKLTATASVVVNSKPDVTLTSSADKFCGDTLTLTATGAQGYAWVGPVIGQGNKVRAVPSTTTVYTVAGTNPGCAPVLASVTMPYKALTVSASAPASACSGLPVTLSATVNNLSYDLFRETFDSPLIGWAFANSDTGPMKDSSGWLPGISARNGIGISTPDGSGFYSPDCFFASKAQAPGGASAAIANLTSPAFSTVGISNLILAFNHYYYLSAGSSLSDVVIIASISTDKTHWTPLFVANEFTNNGSSNGFITTSASIPAQFENQPAVYVSFNFSNPSSDYTSFWAINNVQVSGKKNAAAYASFAWASAPAGFTATGQNPAATALAGTIYQVTATAEGCSKTAVTSPIKLLGGATVALGDIPVRAVGATNLGITFSITGGTASHYSFAPGSTNVLPNFNATALAALPQAVNGVIALPLPVSPAPAGTYNFNLVLQDQVAGCAASVTPFSVQIADGTNNLSSLGLSGAFLLNSFNSGVTSYAAQAASNAAIVNVIPVTEDSRCTLTVNGVATISGAPVAVPLVTGDNIVTIQVTSAGGVVKTYTVTFSRQANVTISSQALFASIVYMLRNAGNIYYTHTAITPPAAVAGFTNAAYPLIRVRRSADNAMLDIGSTGSGSLDTVTLKNFTGTGNGFVAIWFDQSGLSHDAVQNTAASQPRIVNAGVIERKNNQPSVYFYGASGNNVYLASESFSAFSNGFTLFAAAGVKNNNSSNALITKTKANLPAPWDLHDAAFLLGNGSSYNTASMSKPFSASTPFGIWSFYGSSAGGKIKLNETTTGTVSAVNLNYGDSAFPVVLGSRNDGSTRLDGWISEAVIFPYVLTDAGQSNVIALEKAIYLQPFITSFTPVRGSGATVVTITGGNFTGTTQVNFGGVNAQAFTVVNDNTVTATVPNGAASGNITVTTQWGTGAKDGFYYGVPPGNALNFNGVNNSVSLPTSLINNLAQGTYEAWVYLNDNTKATILAKQANGVATNSVFSIGYSASSGGSFSGGTPGKVYFRSQNTSPLLTSNAVLATGHWYHLALVFNNAAASLFVNGVFDTTVSGNFSIPNLQTSATVLPALGAWLGDGGGNYLKGSLDEVRIWNTARTATQVQADMVNIADPASTGLIAYYNFDAGLPGGANTGLDSLYDGIAKTYTAALNNFTLAGPTSNWVESYAMVVTSPTFTNMTDTSFIISWPPSMVGVADNYLMDISSLPGLSSFFTIPVTGTSLAVTGQVPGNEYYVRLRAEKASVTGQGAYSPVIYIKIPPHPVITSFSPMGATRGATVTITGRNFIGTKAVSFGGTPATSYHVISSTTITAVVGAGASGDVSVSVQDSIATKPGFLYGVPPGNALKLNGISQYVTVNTGSNAVSGNYTVEAWVRPMAATGAFNIFSTRTGPDKGFDIKLQDGNIIHGDIGNGTTWLNTNADAPLKYIAGTWYHIAMVVNSSTYTIYANGQQVGTGSLPAGMPLLFDSNHPITIGAVSTDIANGELFKGNIDEVRVYNGALTQADIQADMQSTASAKPGNLVLYYNFDQLSGPVVNDFSSSNYTGTAVNSPVFEESYAMVIPTAKAASQAYAAGFTANWSAPALGIIDSFKVAVAADPAFTNIVPGYDSVQVAGTATSLTITGLAATQTYYYRVRAHKVSVAGQGAWSNLASVTTTGLPSATISGTTQVCKDDVAPAVLFKGFGGTSPYTFTYSINGGAAQTVTSANGYDTVSVPALTAMAAKLVYTLANVTDSLGNTQAQIDSVTITVTAPTASTTPVTICSSVLPYNWNGTGYNNEGTYTIHLTNTAGCDSAATLILTVSQATASTTRDTVSSSDLPFNWNGTDYNTGGTYTIHLTNAAGCDSAVTLILTAGMAPTTATLVSAGNKNNVCYKWSRTITAIATGGDAPYKYSLNGGPYQALPSFIVPAGVYIVSVMGATGSTINTNSVTIVEPAEKLALGVTPSGTAGSVTAIASGGFGGYRYSFNGGAYEVSNIFTGVNNGDSIKTIDKAGCIATVYISPLSVTLRSGKDTVCYGEYRTITASAKGGVQPYLYSLNGGAYQASGSYLVKAGVYAITVMDANGSAVNSNSLIIAQPAAKLAVAITSSGTAGSVTAIASGGFGDYRYSFNGAAYQADNIFTGVNNGDSIKISDKAGCITTVYMSPLQATVRSGKDTICYGGYRTIIAAAKGGIQPYRYSLNGGPYQASGSYLVQAGVYAITVMDATGSTVNSNGLTIAQPLSQLAVTLTKTDVSCKGGNNGIVTATATGGFGNYLYSTDSINYLPLGVFGSLQAGTVRVYTKDGANCLVAKTITVHQPLSPCSSFTAKATTPTSSSADMAGELSVVIAPNPASIEFTLRIVNGDSKKVVELRIMDMNGKTVYHTRGGVFDAYRFGRTFAAGIYLAEVLNGKNVQKVKLVKGN